MKKTFLSLIVLSLISYGVSAQKGNNQISIGPEVDLPVGTFGDAYKVGFGGTIKGLYGIGSAGQITFTTGYVGFKGKSGLYANQKFNIIPLLAGYRQNFKTLYVEPLLGLANYKTKVTGFSESETRFTYGVGVGYSGVVDLGLRFQAHEGASLVALRAAYVIKFKK